MVLVQKWPFFQLVFFSQHSAGKCLLRYCYKEKTLFYAIKWTGSNSGKIDISPKGLTHGFDPKMAIFQIFFFTQYRPVKPLYDNLERKNAFLGYKNNNFKNSKNWHFSTGVNPWFWSKNSHIFNFFLFQQNIQGKCLLRYSRTKKRLSRL